MKERYLEIRFHNFVVKLLKSLHYSIDTIDIIEVYANVGGADSLTIKKIVQKIRNGTSLTYYYTEEAVYIARQLGISYRKLMKEADISKATQYRASLVIEQELWKYENITKKLPDEQYEQIEKFMRIVDLIKEL